MKQELTNLKECKDYEIIKSTLSKEQLISIEKALQEFHIYTNKYDMGSNDVINEYIQEYGNNNIICWYEGLKSTKEFLDDFIKESEVNNSNEL